MPAQLIVVAKATAEKAVDKSKPDPEEKSGSGAAQVAAPKSKPKIPPFRKLPFRKLPVYRPLPIHVLKVFGQEPKHLGHFEDVATLLDKVHAQKKLPGGSNTIFGSVGNLDDVQSELVRGKLERLPEALTIVVHEGEHDA
jgi:hypothetical protein